MITTSILDRIFNRKERSVTTAKLVTEPTGGFSGYSSDAYANDVYREAVDAIARNAGKLKGSHIVAYTGKDRQGGDGRLNRLLQVRPNPYMSAYDMLYKLVTHLFLNNNAFAYLDRDAKGSLRRSLDRNIIEAVKAKFPTETFKTVVRNNSKLAEAPTFGQDIFEYDAKSSGAEAYRAIAKEIIEREG